MENGKKNPCQGNHREFGNFAKTQGIWFTQVVNPPPPPIPFCTLPFAVISDKSLRKSGNPAKSFYRAIQCDPFVVSGSHVCVALPGAAGDTHGERVRRGLGRLLPRAAHPGRAPEPGSHCALLAKPARPPVQPGGERVLSHLPGGAGGGRAAPTCHTTPTSGGYRASGARLAQDVTDDEAGGDPCRVQTGGSIYWQSLSEMPLFLCIQDVLLFSDV